MVGGVAGGIIQAKICFDSEACTHTYQKLCMQQNCTKIKTTKMSWRARKNLWEIVLLHYKKASLENNLGMPSRYFCFEINKIQRIEVLHKILS